MPTRKTVAKKRTSRKTTYPQQPETVIIPKKKVRPPRPEPDVHHSATEHVVKPLEIPDISNLPYNWLEIPRGMVSTDGISSFKEPEKLGDNDRLKIRAFVKLLDDGFRIKTLTMTPNGNYLFLFEK